MEHRHAEEPKAWDPWIWDRAKEGRKEGVADYKINIPLKICLWIVISTSQLDDFDYALTKKKYLLRRYNTVSQYESELQTLHSEFETLHHKYKDLCYSLEDTEEASHNFRNQYERLVKEADDTVQDIERRLVGSIKYSRSSVASIRSKSPRSHQSIYSAPLK